MEKEWNTVDLLRFARHDWLNKIQLIKGNLSLGKLERVKEIIDEIVFQTQQESKLSNLSLPQLATLLLTYNWRNSPIVLDFEIETGDTKNVDDGEITSWLKHFFYMLESNVDEMANNFLTITIQPEVEVIRFIFDFNGILKDKDLFQTFMKENASYITSTHWNEDEFTLEVCWK